MCPLTCCERLIKKSRVTVSSVQSAGGLWGHGHYLPNWVGSYDLQKERGDAWKVNSPGKAASLVPLQWLFTGRVHPGRWDGDILSNWMLPTGLYLELECTGKDKPVGRSHIRPCSFVLSQRFTTRVLGQVCSFWLGKIPVVECICLSGRVPKCLSTFQALCWDLSMHDLI